MIWTQRKLRVPLTLSSAVNPARQFNHKASNKQAVVESLRAPSPALSSVEKGTADDRLSEKNITYTQFYGDQYTYDHKNDEQISR